MGISHVGALENRLNKLVIAGCAFLKMREIRVEMFHWKVKVLENAIEGFDGGVPLLHAHNILASVAAIGKGAPIISTVHGPMYEHARESGMRSERLLSLVRDYESMCFSHSSVFIAVDSGQRDLLVQKGVAENKIKVIHNSVDVDTLRVTAAAQEPTTNGDYFIMSRRFAPKNGLLVAVEAFLDWVGRRNFQFVIAGDGQLKAQILNLVNSHRNGDKVKLVGSLDHSLLLPLTRHAKASVVPSIPFEGVIEATSLSALESLALDVPVIASNIGGLTEIDGGTGLLTLVPPGDKHALMEAFELWSHRDKHDLGDRLSEHVRSKFGVQRWLREHLEVYRSVCPDLPKPHADIFREVEA